MFAPDLIPEADEYGFFMHPDLDALLDEQAETISFSEADSYLFSFTEFETDAPDELIDAFYEREDMTATAKWVPTAPNANGSWLLIAMYDTENGPIALFASPKEAAA